MPYTEARGTRIYYESRGEGPALVFVHGSGGNHVIWWQQVPYFSQRYQTITIDLCGFGNSRNVAEGPDSLNFPDEVLSVLDALQVTKAALVGQSIGALACLRLALEHPQRVSAVVLAHSTANIDDAGLSRSVAKDRAEADKLPVLDRLMSRNFQMRNPALTWLFQQIGTVNAANQRTIRNLQSPGPTPVDIAKAGVPILFLAGENDAVISIATLRLAHKLVVGSELAIVPDGPHSLYWENPAVFNCAVDQFLREQQPA
jgi:pimeloyl-ACP methyl ester carboxylesterase